MCSGSVTWLRRRMILAGAAWVTGNPLPFMEYLDDGAADADIHLFADQAEGDGIPGTVDFDMIVRGNAGALTQNQIGRANS